MKGKRFGKGLIYDLTQAESIIDTGSIHYPVGRAKARTASGLGEVGRRAALALATVMTCQAIYSDLYTLG